MRRVCGLAAICLLLFSSVVLLLLVETATANFAPPYIPPPLPHYPIITINNDGSISPQTDLIIRDGETYQLAANITDHRIHIERSCIVFDGNGHSINLWNESASGLSVKHAGFGVRNVVIKNLEVSGSVWLDNCSFCQITGVKVNNSIVLIGGSSNNNVSKCICSIRLSVCSNNFLFQNNISQLSVWHYAKSNVLYENNFVCDDYDSSSRADCFWDNGSIGNYWIGYNGRDDDEDGIGDTPYVLKDANIIDHYPLMYPYEIESNKVDRSTSASPQTQSSLFVLLAGIFLLSAVVTAVGLLYLRRKKRSPQIASSICC
jgi:hypothetical protein